MENDKKIEVKKVKKEEKQASDKKSRELAIRKESPFSLFQKMDKMFDSLWRDADDWFWPFGRRRIIVPMRWEEAPIFRTPLSNITETEDGFSISAELPGLDKGEIQITFDDGLLEIKGEQKKEEKEEREGYVRREYSSASYYRAFHLPENIDEENIEANLDKGILTVLIPKKEPEKKEKKKNRS
ncbi:MAG: Hsp20/alpha crystallin family protein [Promethearchaeota archaeon]